MYFFHYVIQAVAEDKFILVKEAAFCVLLSIFEIIRAAAKSKTPPPSCSTKFAVDLQNLKAENDEFLYGSLCTFFLYGNPDHRRQQGFWAK